MRRTDFVSNAPTRLVLWALSVVLLRASSSALAAPAPDNLVLRARKLTKICTEHGVDLKAAALQFVLAHPAVATAIPGAQSIDELEQNIAMVQQEIPVTLWNDMRSEGLIPDDAPTPT